LLKGCIFVEQLRNDFFIGVFSFPETDKSISTATGYFTPAPFTVSQWRYNVQV